MVILLERIRRDSRFLGTNLGVECELWLLSLLFILVLTPTIDIIAFWYLSHWSLKCLSQLRTTTTCFWWCMLIPSTRCKRRYISRWFEDVNHRLWRLQSIRVIDKCTWRPLFQQYLTRLFRIGIHALTIVLSRLCWCHSHTQLLSLCFRLYTIPYLRWRYPFNLSFCSVHS